MPHPFTMQCRENNKDLHVKVSGDFYPNNAGELKELLRSYTGAGRIFMDVRALRVAVEEHRHAFRQCLDGLPAERIFFKGEQGFSLGREGSRVLIIKEKACRCAGACAVCACSRRAMSRRALMAESAAREKAKPRRTDVPADVRFCV